MISKSLQFKDIDKHILKIERTEPEKWDSTKIVLYRKNKENNWESVFSLQETELTQMIYFALTGKELGVAYDLVEFIKNHHSPE